MTTTPQAVRSADAICPAGTDAWFTDYPSTHERAGETVEVVARWVYEALAERHAAAEEALREVTHERHVNAQGGIESRPSAAAEIAIAALDRLGVPS